MDADQSPPTQGPAPDQQPGWGGRLLEHLGLTLPTSWSATKAEIVGKVVVTVGTGALLAAVYWVTDVARDGLQYAYREAKDYVVGLPKADPNAPLSVLVARLAGDDGSQTERVMVSLRRAFGRGPAGQAAQVQDAKRTLAPGKSGDDIRDHDKAEAEGRRWLRETGANILVWGDVAAKDKVLRLYFVLNTGQADRPARESYTLSDRLELASDFQEDLGAVIAGLVTALAASADDTSRPDELLNELRMRLEAIRRQMAQGAMSDTLSACKVTIALASVSRVIGVRKAGSRDVSEAAGLYRDVLKNKSCLDDPAFVLSTRNDFGVTLMVLGMTDPDTRPLEEGVTLFRAALEDVKRERAPRDWAMIQNNLGSVLNILGQRNKDTSRSEEAVSAFRNALQEFTRERDPNEWAMAQANLGASLFAAAFPKFDKDRLYEALAALTNAAEEFGKDETSIRWATIQYNIGVFSYALGSAGTGTAQLEQASTAFRAAQQAFEKLRNEASAQLARQSLAATEALLAERRAAK
ncbi:MAG: hypothetical protein WDO17_01580 [Alphaproteobacteria bacterium]